jgi:hypothetical protein
MAFQDAGSGGIGKVSGISDDVPHQKITAVDFMQRPRFLPGELYRFLRMSITGNKQSPGNYQAE